MKTKNFKVVDAFNGHQYSNHRTLHAAGLAVEKIKRGCEKANVQCRATVVSGKAEWKWDQVENAFRWQ